MPRCDLARCTGIDALPGISTPRWNPGRVWYLIPGRPFSGVEGAVAFVSLQYGGRSPYNVAVGRQYRGPSARICTVRLPGRAAYKARPEGLEPPTTRFWRPAFFLLNYGRLESVHPCTDKTATKVYPDVEKVVT